MLLVMTKNDNRPLGFTRSGNDIVTGVPHQLLTGNAVQFSTTATLPSPIVADTTYYVQSLVNSTTFTIATVLGGSVLPLTTAGSGQMSVQNTTLDSVIQAKIVLAKRKIYNALLMEVSNRVPMIAQRWMNRKRGQVDYFAQELKREFEILAKTAQVPIVPGVYDGSVIDLYMLLSMTQGLVPRTFSAPLAPVNGTQGTYAGTAYPGAVYVDVSSGNGDRMYYNTGTLNAPIWTRPNAAFVLNNILNANAGRIASATIGSGGANYSVGDEGIISGGNVRGKYVVRTATSGVVTSIVVTNAGATYTAGTKATIPTTGMGTGLTLALTDFYDSVLLEAAVDYTLWRMAEDGMFRNVPMQSEVAYGAEGKYAKAALRSLSEAVPLLDIDIDQDGVISDFEAELFHAPQGVFA